MPFVNIEAIHKCGPFVACFTRNYVLTFSHLRSIFAVRRKLDRRRQHFSLDACVCVCLLVLLLWLILLLLLCVSLVNYFDVNVWRYLSFVGWPAKWWIQPKSEDKANICIFTPKAHNMPLSYATHTHTQTHIWVNWMCDEHIYDGEMASWMTKR